MATLKYLPRTTRSGRVFGLDDTPTAIQPILCHGTVDIEALLREATEYEFRNARTAEDVEHRRGPSLSNDATNSTSNTTSNDATSSDTTRSGAKDSAQKRAAEPACEDTGTQTAPKKPKRSHVHRAHQRQAAFVQHGHHPRVDPGHNHVGDASTQAVFLDLDASSLPATSCGYQAKSKSRGVTRAEVHSLEHYRDTLGWPVAKWDGEDTRIFTDSKSNKNFLYLVAPPKGESWRATVRGATKAMEDARRNATWKPEEAIHGRGRFFVVNDGIYDGQGSREPHRLNTGPHADMVRELRENEHIARMAAFASASLAAYAPKVYEYYDAHDCSLRQHLPHLKPNFPKSVFSCAAYNFGPIVCTFPHTDCLNCPFGFCAIQALGDFDHTKGGHLVIEDLQLIVEFPAGTTILLPSAVLTHANTPVQAHEKRLSFTQYTPGNVLRFVDNCFMTQAKLKETLSAEDFQAQMDKKKTRWKDGLAMWSTPEELWSRSQEALCREGERRREGAKREEELRLGAPERRKAKKAARKIRRLLAEKEEGEI